MQKPKQINWGPVLFLSIYQLALLVSLPVYLYYNSPSVAVWITAFILLYLTGLSITGGYHRLYAHRTYRTNNIIEGITLFLASMAAQGSALRWAFDHRIHHAFVDTDNDPYNINQGFWYAHMLWILEKPREIASKTVPDLIKNKLVMFQHNNYKACMIGSNAITTLFFGWLFNDYLAALMIILGLRLFTLHHFTWFINSLAHTWGEKPFCQEQSAVDNYFLSMLTFGEGYHNYHHTFANDYRNGIRWFHFDPTKWLLWTLHKLGLVYDLKKTDEVTIRRKMVLEHKNMLLEKLSQLCVEKKEELETTIQEISDRMVAKIAQFHALRKQYQQTRKEKPSRDLIRELREELKELKRSLKDDWKTWLQLSESIMNNKLLPA